MRATRWMVVVAVAVVVAATAWVLLSRPGAPPPERAMAKAAPPAPAPPPRTPWCRPAEERRFGFTHQSTAWATVVAETNVAPKPGQAVQVDTQLRGVLVVRCDQDPAVDLARVGFRVESLEVGHVQAQGQEAFTAEERLGLLATELLVDMRRSGEVVELRFTEPNSELGQNLLQAVLADIQVRVLDSPVYTAEERTLNGTVVSRYREQRAGKERSLAREREKFTRLRASEAYGHELPYELHANAGIQLESSLVRELASEENLVTGGMGQGGPHLETHAVTTLKYLGRADAPARPAARVGPAVVQGDLAVHTDFGAKMLAARVEGLTGAQVKDTLLRFANGGQLPDHNRFLWRATGLLRAQPELVEELAALFHDAHFNSRGRQLILDLLVGAGTREAQAALRTLLASRTAQEDPNYGLFYQRLGLLSAPDDATVATARAHYATPGAETKGAAVYAFGAVLGNRLTREDPAARAAADGVLQDLRGASSTEDQVLLLTALGNAGVPEHAAAISGMASSASPEVRRAVANALRKDRDDATTGVLLALVGDDNVDVQRRALMSLMGRPLGSDAFAVLAEIVRRGRLGMAAYDLLLDLVSPSLHDPAARAAVHAVVERDVPNLQVLGRAREMLALYETVPSAPEPEDLDEFVGEPTP